MGSRVNRVNYKKGNRKFEYRAFFFTFIKMHVLFLWTKASSHSTALSNQYHPKFSVQTKSRKNNE
jgi:hypothetical protein